MKESTFKHTYTEEKNAKEMENITKDGSKKIKIIF